MSPSEYADFLASKIPQGNGQVPQYAGDALANPNQSSAQLNTDATNLNNSRNDIATGTTDPYKAGSQSGIAYSPTELNAIEKAYAGVYDPALNDVFNRLKASQDADKAKTDLQQAKDLETFKTNEAIRQWRATTGTKPTSTTNDFTKTQLDNGASDAGMGIEAFKALDPDVKNYYINQPTTLDSDGKKITVDQQFKNYFADVKSGDKKASEVAALVADSTLPPAVKHHLVSQIPLDAPVKESIFQKIWATLKGE